MNLPRLGWSVLIGAVATAALFFLMQWLIADRRGEGVDDVYGQVVDFVRVREDTAAQRRQRKPPKEIERPEPKTPALDVGPAQKPRLEAPRSVSTNVDLDFALAGGLDFDGIPSDADVIPLVRIEPRYPDRALSRGIEGWVLLEFSVSPAGTVEDIVVVDADPPRVFNSAAERAVRRWKYKPRIQDGNAVMRTGVQVVLTFQMED